MSNKELSQKIARYIFECGEELGHPITRMEFKTGEWPDNEKGMGGLCESALAGVIQSALERHLLRED